MQTWLTSDTHFSHANVIVYCNRPFASEQEMLERKILPESVNKMNEIMIRNWNFHVQSEDRVIHVGDFAMSAKVVQSVMARLNGEVELYLGNHDFPHPAHQKGRKLDLREKWTKEYLDYGFKSVQLEGFINVPGVANFRIYHIPYAGSCPEDTHQNGEPRHMKDALIDDGVPLICGHIHEKWLFRRTAKGTPMINVGVDAPGAPWSGQFRPATLEEVVEVYLENTKSS